MKPIYFVLCVLAVMAVGCGVIGTPPRPPQAQSQPEVNATSPTVKNEAGGGVLLFTIGMHIEPFGETAQGYPGGNGNYHQENFFNRQAQDILTVTQIVEAHGGRMTIQSQSPFTQVVVESGNTILKDLATRGHEMALHFHEDAHMGRNGAALSVQQWCDVMKEEIGYITQASSAADVRYWSGGNLYVDIYKAASCAGLDVNSDWKNPKLQETPLDFVGIHPWRPAGGTDGVDLADFTRHDAGGAIVFLPEGQYDKTNFASMRRSETAGGDEAYFEYLKESLYASLAIADPNKVNVFHFTVHPGEFRGDPQNPFGVIENFLTEVVDPLVASGQVKWATFSDMADAYAAWEQANPGVAPR